MTRRPFVTSVSLVLFALPMSRPISRARVLIITGDHGHAWKETTPYLKDLLTRAGMTVDVTETPRQGPNSDNLAKYDVLLLNYKDTKKGAPERLVRRQQEGLHRCGQGWQGAGRLSPRIERVSSGATSSPRSLRRSSPAGGGNRATTATGMSSSHGSKGASDHQGPPRRYAALERRAIPELGDAPG